MGPELTGLAQASPGGRMAAFANPGFKPFWISLLMTNFAVQIQTVAVGWHVYDLTRNPLDLGLVGLSQFLPALALVPVTGTAADRWSRRAIMGVCQLLMAVVGLVLWWAAEGGGGHSVGPILWAMALFGAARAFYNPARTALVPNLVPREHLATAVAANSMALETATIGGPLAGGLLYAFSPTLAYGTVIALLIGAAMLVLLFVPRQGRDASRGPVGLKALLAGFGYIWSHKPVLGAISLDLFAVFFGGAIALLPIFASDILAIGAFGLGLLRAGPAVGALLVGLLLMLMPIRDHAGKFLFVAVAAFGLATIVFALSSNLWLSLGMLVIMGASDMVSVNIRSILIQLWTPDELRGRVSSVNQVFVGTSNELGGFRAGVMAAWIGPVPAVAVGGVAILGVVAAWMRLFPGVVQVRHLR